MRPSKFRKFGVFFAILGAGIFFHIQPARANSIGISPARLITALLPGSVSEQSFTISRNNLNTDAAFAVSVVEAPPYIELAETAVVIPEGTSEVQVPFTINTTDLELGEYEALFHFAPTDVVETESGIDVQFVFTGIVEFSVVEVLPDEYAAVDFEEFVDSIEVFEANSFASEKIQYTVHDTAQFSWTFTNTGDTPIYNVPYTFTVKKDDGVVYNTTSSVGDFISAGDSAELFLEYTFVEYGQYEVVLSAFGNEQSIVIDVYSDSFIIQYANWILAVGILLILFSVIVLIRTRTTYGEYIHFKWVTKAHGIFAAAVIAGFTFGLTIVWISAQPEPKLVEKMNKHLDGAVVITYEEDDVRKNTIIPTNGRVGDLLHGEWQFLAASADRMYAIPVVTNGIAQESTFYIITPDIEYAYATADLPGPITRISENSARSYMLIEGYDSVDQTAYYCVSSIVLTEKPDCTYLGATVAGTEIIRSVAWKQDSERKIAIETESATLYEYDPWTEESVEVDSISQSDFLYTPIESLQQQEQQTYRTGVSGIHTFLEYERKYNMQGVDAYHLDDEWYVLLLEREDDTVVYLFDVITGEYRVLRTMPQNADVYYMVAGSLVSPEVE